MNTKLEIELGKSSRIVVSFEEYKGRWGLNIRVWLTTGHYTGPTKSGVIVPVEDIPKLRDFLNQLELKQ